MKIIIFGTGSVAEALFEEIDFHKAEVLAFVNSNAEIREFHGYPVIVPEQISKYSYDHVIVASGYFLQIEGLLLTLGVSQDKIVGFIYDEEESYQDMAGALSGYLNDRYQRDVINRIVRSDRLYPEIFPGVMWKNTHLKGIRKDFVREQNAALMADEIQRKNVQGAVAELGVFRGDFTVVMNRIFPDRRFYLFDTFCGFAEHDVETDDKVENKQNELLKFRDTSEELVLSRLGEGRERCVVKKGYFPDTFDLYEESFCFVSIDMNMYQPVSRALELFWPRMEKGGYILVSDFNAPFYEGTRKAVLDFCGKRDIPFLPIPDLYGSAVLCKWREES